MTVSAHPYRFRRLPTAEVDSRRVPVAVTLLSRLLGLALLSSERAGEGLLIPRCHSVHTFGMRFAIDVHFLDRDLCPLATVTGLAPNRVAGHRGCAAVLERPSALPEAG